MAGIERGRLGSTAVPATGEAFMEVAALGATRVEEIVSSDAPDPGEQVQDHDEWVAVLSGRAALEVDGSPVDLEAGDWIVLRAGTPHRVLRTEPGTRWLAVHAPGGAAS